MATTGQSVVDRARILLNDTLLGAYRWADAELLKWLNDGQKFIVVVRPDVAATTESLTLVDGTKQTIPATGLRLLDVVRNTTTNKAVRYVDRHILDTSIPDWHAVRTSFAVTNWVYDNRVPLTFYVYPPAKAGAVLEIVYSKMPVDLGSMASNISLPDIYSEPLLNYVMSAPTARTRRTRRIRSWQRRTWRCSPVSWASRRRCVVHVAAKVADRRS